eukprot:gnl/MRDRNA2_/MRDRNA2_205091_c0_seq1.p1 gnl/MRDRNA2_/MRDRNA2_205091_c0~~gnl/MRDRNA2_/MRDRNA2_205091_c0_seq1.p1  ORF type:complete len:105 (+),score=3.70 gnl/MRDRNA2_/MRDRNA2_205091_c0_seq1:27-317(+)
MTNNDYSMWPAVANAQTALASPCSVKSLTHCCAAFANTLHSCTPKLLASANAHAMLTRLSPKNSPKEFYAAISISLNSCVSDRPTFAKAHAKPASS